MESSQQAPARHSAEELSAISETEPSRVGSTCSPFQRLDGATGEEAADPSAESHILGTSIRVWMSDSKQAFCLQG